MAKWKFTIEAQSPAGQIGTWQTGFAARTLEFLISKGHKEKLARARLVEGVLKTPETIIQGWGRDKDDCLIYVGSPRQDFRSDSVETPPPRGMLFLVFVFPDGTIDDWG